MLDQDDIRRLFGNMWTLNQTERLWLDRIYGYVTGILGKPEVPDGSPQEIIDLCRLSIKNVLGLVRDSFAQNLSVIGYHTALAQENGPAWDMWQRNRMDARQAEVYRPAITYGAAYVIVTKDPDSGDSVWRCKSPRQLLAVYEDPSIDLWPTYGLEVWIDQGDAKAHWVGRFYDDEYIYPLQLGGLQVLPIDQYATSIVRTATIQEFGEPIRHGGDNCPIVRFVNARDPDDMIVGEIAPLMRTQQAINCVNFDRLLVSRFGAFPQKVITGWSAATSVVLEASAKRVWAFDDPGVEAHSFPPASLEQYNGVIQEMTEALALTAQISPHQITGKMINMSAEALAAAEANQQRKLQSKRDGFGESWEQVFRLAAAIEGDTASAEDTSSEVVWRDTEARAFGAIVDGITKLSAAGIPIEELVDMVPGVTQQKIESIKAALRMGQVNELIKTLSQPAPGPVGVPPGAPAPPAVTTPAAAAAPAPNPANMPRAGAARNAMVTA
jgi:hypothetical protein